MQAPAPSRLIEGGMPEPRLPIAQVLVSKYADHLPLYRQAQIYARQGIGLDRSTLADWVGHAAWHLRPLHERLLTKLKELPRLFADETTAPVLDPGRGCTKTGQLGPMPPTTGHGAAGSTGRRLCLRTRSQIGAANHPSGGLQGHPAGRRLCRLRKLADRGDVRLAFCWSHVRRGFYQARHPGCRRPSPKKRSNVSPRYMPSRRISAVGVLRSAEQPGTREAVR